MCMDRPAPTMEPSRSIASSSSALPGPMAVSSPQNSMIFSLSGPTLDIANLLPNVRLALVYPFGRDNPGPPARGPALAAAPGH